MGLVATGVPAHIIHAPLAVATNVDTQPETEPIVLQQITITRSLQPDGTETYRVDYQGDVGWVEGLGLIEAAKFDLVDQCRPEHD